MLWGRWHGSVYHTVIIIKSKSCQYLLARGAGLSALLKQLSICLIGFWSHEVSGMTRALVKAALAEMPPHHKLVLFLLQQDPAGGGGFRGSDNTNSPMIVFVYSVCSNMRIAVSCPSKLVLVLEDLMIFLGEGRQL